MKDSTLTRHVTPGQSPAEEGQNFLEVIENMAGAEQPSGENPGSDRNKREQARQRNPAASPTAPVDTDTVAKDPAAISPDGQIAPSHKKTPSEDEPLGAHIDMTA